MAGCYHTCMGQLLIRQLDDEKLERLKSRARERKMSTEALARETLHKAAELSVAEKLEIVDRMRARIQAARVPGTTLTPSLELIRETRNDH